MLLPRGSMTARALFGVGNCSGRMAKTGTISLIVATRARSGFHRRRWCEAATASLATASLATTSLATTSLATASVAVAVAIVSATAPAPPLPPLSPPPPVWRVEFVVACRRHFRGSRRGRCDTTAPARVLDVQLVGHHPSLRTGSVVATALIASGSEDVASRQVLT